MLISGLVGCVGNKCFCGAAREVGRITAKVGRIALHTGGILMNPSRMVKNAPLGHDSGAFFMLFQL